MIMSRQGKEGLAQEETTPANATAFPGSLRSAPPEVYPHLEGGQALSEHTERANSV